MQQILLVEDSMMFGRLAKKKIEDVFRIPVFWARSLAETQKLLEEENGKFSVALLDFNLPDAPQGEVIDRVVGEGISSIVFTTNMSDEMRSLVWGKNVAEYIIKEDPNSLDYVVAVIQQFLCNQETLVLVVDDSDEYRGKITEMLYVRQYRVLNASDCVTALNILKQYPDIQLVVTDFSMKDFDGALFCQKIRGMYSAQDLAIVGFIPEEDRLVGIKYIKSGASDFIIKAPFLAEEFYYKISHALEVVKLHRKLNEKGEG